MKREAKELNNLIEQVSQKVVDKVVNEKYLVSRMAVIVNEFDPNTNSASIIIPTDLSNHTDYKYPNRTGMTSLRSTVWENGQIKTYGDKVYLVYQSNNISQGWLESNKSLDIVKEVSRDYLTKADAAATYETKANASATYETKANASATYETKTNAAATYETKTNASNTYVKKSGDTMTGVLHIKASGWNARASAIDTVHNGEVDLAFGVNHTDHGVYSTGYSTDGSSWTSNGKWLIYRGTGGIGVAGNAIVIDTNNNATINGNTNANGYIQTNGSGANSRIVAQDSVHNGQVRLTFVNNHTQHGIYSTGYSTDGKTWTSDGKWIICRTSDNKVRLSGSKATVDANGNIRAEGYVSLGGNVYADGGDIHAGTTTKARTANNGVHSVAGKIYLHTEGTTSGKRGLWVSNRSDTYKEIISVDQNNVATFYGHTTRSAIWAKGSGSHSIAVSATGIPAKVQVKQVGSDFTISNGNVICGRAGTVRVTCKLFVWSNVVNGGGMTAWIRVSGTNNTDTQTTMSPFTNGVMYLEGIFTVSANTAINYQIRNDSGSATLSHQATSSMIVEYLD